ncbi:S-adenosyl-L-methionine-dependent methyltransferase [Rhypophila sp. PSN 637]
MVRRGRKPAALRHEQGPILIEDDDDNDDIIIGHHNNPVQQQEAITYNTENDDPDVIDLEELIQQEAAENDLFGELAEVIDLTDDLIVEAERQIGRSPPVLRTLPEYKLPGGFMATPGKVLQIINKYRTPAEHEILYKLQHDFFHAEPLFGTGDEPVFRGRLYARARGVDTKFPRKLNEVVHIANVDLTDPRPWQEQCLVDIPISLLGPFRELRVTNAGYPEFKYDSEEFARYNLNRPGYIHDFGPLEKIRQRRPHEWAIERVPEDEVLEDKYKRASDDLRTEWRGGQWRGGRRRGGSYVPDPRSQRSDATQLRPRQMYTAGDTFAGGGGASRGMTMAGAFVEFAVDNWDRAVQSLEANFAPETNVYHLEVTDMISNPGVGHVDILHLSPPCQVWSPAHTVPGKNDAMNEAILFSCGGLLEKFKPRMFTLEQTFGILHERFNAHFSRLMADFVELGYSIRWQVVNLATFGLPQPRKRLIILGAGPGETLPDFPKPTHCLDRHGHHGLKPFVSARQAIAHLEDNWEWDDGPDHQYLSLRTLKPPWDPDRLMNTITCGGGHNNHHWDGERELSILEFAALQGFPIEHKFVGSKTDKKKQIGNAFPPKVVKVFYEHLIACLDKIDGITHRPKGGSEVDPELIDVDEYVPVPQRRRKGGQPIDRSASASTFSGSGLSVDDPMEID